MRIMNILVILDAKILTWHFSSLKPLLWINSRTPHVDNATNYPEFEQNSFEAKFGQSWEQLIVTSSNSTSGLAVGWRHCWDLWDLHWRQPWEMQLDRQTRTWWGNSKKQIIQKIIFNKAENTLIKIIFVTHLSVEFVLVFGFKDRVTRWRFFLLNFFAFLSRTLRSWFV